MKRSFYNKINKLKSIEFYRRIGEENYLKFIKFDIKFDIKFSE